MAKPLVSIISKTKDVRIRGPMVEFVKGNRSKWNKILVSDIKKITSILLSLSFYIIEKKAQNRFFPDFQRFLFGQNPSFNL